MAILITEPIPKQGFEIVGEQLGAILKIELEGQRTLKNMQDVFDVYSERTSPYDKGEGTMVNVLLDGGEFDVHNPSGQQGKTRFNVDVYAAGRSNPDKRGDAVSIKLVQSYIGMIRYILSSTKYKTLGLPPGTIGGTYVTGHQVYDIDNNQDASYVRMMRLTYEVRIYETQQLWAAVPLLINNTQVKLDDTEKGHLYIIENNN